MDNKKILISHTVEEKDLAQAWKSLIETTTSGAVEVWFSSDDSPLGGMEVGREWREDLYQRLKDCEFVLAIQTPVSVGKPWIMWECGVASGVDKERGIIPIIFGMARGYLPNPLNVYQSYEGDKTEQIREVCERLAHKAGLKPPDFIYDQAIQTYLSAVVHHRSRKSVRPEDIAMWTNRLKELVLSGRVSELNNRRQQMYTSLGEPPLNSDLHDLLSRLFLQNHNFKESLEETDYGLALLPGDPTLLHRKALALTELHNLDEAQTIIEEIISIDEKLSVDIETAALSGRIHRERWLVSRNRADLNAAFDAYYRAYQANPNSYYIGVNAMALAFAKEEKELATSIAHEVLALCQKEQRKQNVTYWVDFTAGEVYLALGDIKQAASEYEQGLKRVPEPGKFERISAAKGAARMIQIKQLPKEVLDRIDAILR